METGCLEAPLLNGRPAGATALDNAFRIPARDCRQLNGDMCKRFMLETGIKCNTQNEGITTRSGGTRKESVLNQSTASREQKANIKSDSIKT